MNRKIRSIQYENALINGVNRRDTNQFSRPLIETRTFLCRDMDYVMLPTKSCAVRYSNIRDDDLVGHGVRSNLNFSDRKRQ